MILVALGSLALALVSMGGTETQISANLLRSTQALDLAEAGAERGIAQFVTDPTPVDTACSPFCPNPPPAAQPLFGGAQPLGNLGTYTVTYRPIAPATVLIQSTGQTQIGGTQQIVQVIATTQWSSRYGVLSGQVEVPGRVTGLFGAIHGNTQTQIAATSFIEQTATSSGPQCELCTTPGLVGNPAGSGPNKPTVTIPPLNPQSLLPKADYVLGDGTTVVNGTLVPNGTILIAATGQLVPQNTGIFTGWTGGSAGWTFTGNGNPPNGTYYASQQIHVQGDVGLNNTPWMVTLLAGTTTEEGQIEIQGNVHMVSALQDLLFVAGEVEVARNGAAMGMTASLTGTIWSSRTLPPTPPRIGEVEIHAGVTLNGNIVAAAQSEIHAGATINHNVLTRTGVGGGKFQVLSWSSR